MPPRKGLNVEYQQVGLGGLCFVSTLNFMNVEMSYEQRLWMLESEYYCILAKIEDDKKWKDDPEICKLVKETRTKLNQAGEDYLSSYEDHKSHSDDENKYRQLLCQIFGKITQLLGKTKMIEKERVEQDVFA